MSDPNFTGYAIAGVKGSSKTAVNHATSGMCDIMRAHRVGGRRFALCGRGCRNVLGARRRGLGLGPWCLGFGCGCLRLCRRSVLLSWRLGRLLLDRGRRCLRLLLFGGRCASGSRSWSLSLLGGRSLVITRVARLTALKRKREMQTHFWLVQFALHRRKGASKDD